MTNDDVRRAQQRIADIREVFAQDMAGAGRPPITAAARLGAPFAVGDRVFDRRSGREGEVIDVRTVDRTGAVSVWVTFDDGGHFVGPAGDLIARPRPPAARA
jgi:hypothetical protein